MSKTPFWWNVFPWILACIVVSAGFFVWAPSGQIAISSLYDLFPVLGIWAWSIMWTHYVIGEVRRLNQTLPKNYAYSKVSMYIVLALIILHPSLLALAQYQNKFGLPPWSYFTYAGQRGTLAIYAAEIALVFFLSYEFFERAKNNPQVIKHWWLVNLTQSAAMLLILYHSLTLGQHLQTGWFRTYWIALGVILVPCLLHTHWADWKEKHQNN